MAANRILLGYGDEDFESLFVQSDLNFDVVGQIDKFTFESNSSGQLELREGLNVIALFDTSGTTINNLTFTVTGDLDMLTNDIINVANVAIGNATVGASKLIVNGDTNSAHFLHGDANITDTFIHIGGAIANQRKVAIIQEPNGGFGRGKLHFALNNDDDNTNVSKSDIVMTLLDIGNVGIGTETPSELLQVEGNIRVGNVGIGTNPAAGNKLDVLMVDLDIINFAGTGASERLHLQVKNSISAIELGIAGQVNDFFNGVAEGDAFIRAQNQALNIGTFGDDDIIFYTNDVEEMRIVSNGNIGIGTNAPATSAKLDISSTTGSLLLSRMTTGERNSLTAVNGMIIYNSSTNAFNFYENGSWVTGSGLT